MFQRRPMGTTACLRHIPRETNIARCPRGMVQLLPGLGLHFAQRHERVGEVWSQAASPSVRVARLRPTL